MTGMAVGRIFGILVTVWMLYSEYGLWAIPFGMLISEFLILGVNIPFVLTLFRIDRVSGQLDKKVMMEYVKTSPALLLAKSSNSLSQQSEPLLITVLINAEATTIYMIARKAADMVFMLISVITGSILGSVSHLAGEGDREKMSDIIQKLVFMAFVLSLIGFAVYIAANNAFVSLWVGENYLLSQEIILLIGVGFFSRALRGMLWQLLYSVGDFTYTSVIVLIEGVFKVLMSIVLLGYLGIVGIPCAIVASSYLTLISLGLRLKHLFFIKIEAGSVVRLVLLIVAGILVTQIPTNHDSWFSFIQNITVLIVGFGLIVSLVYWRKCIRYFSKGNLWRF